MALYTFVYSLVAYYLIKDNNATWSNGARIARWQIRDGVKASGFTVDNNNQQVANGVDCAGYEEKYIQKDRIDLINLSGTSTN